MGSMSLEWARPDADTYAIGFAPAPAWRFDKASRRLLRDAEALIEEVPVELRYEGQEPIVMMATPLDIEDFALGFYITEGIVDHASQVLEIEAVPANAGFFVAIRLAPECAERVASRRRIGAAGSGCGVCGVAEVGHALRIPASLPLGARFAPEAIERAMEAIEGLQHIGRQTGSAHGAAFADASGHVLAMAEDAGRHNALDKLIGMMARKGIAPAEGFCVTTSRASYEMAQKAASAGIPMLCAMSAATGLAQRLARACGLTLCAFVRRGSFECLSAPERIFCQSHGACVGPESSLDFDTSIRIQPPEHRGDRS
jgi:FdhD protein